MSRIERPSASCRRAPAPPTTVGASQSDWTHQLCRTDVALVRHLTPDAANQICANTAQLFALRTMLRSTNLAVNRLCRTTGNGMREAARTANATSEPATAFENSPDFVQSLARGLLVLRSFDAEHPELSLAEIATLTGLSRAAVRRVALTLQHLGYMREAGRGYALSPRVLELGFGYLGTLDLTDLAQPRWKTLPISVNQSCSMAVLDGQSIVYVARVPVRRVMSISLGVGARLPAFAASMGRVMLSGLVDADLKAWLAQCQPAKLTPHTVTDLRRLKNDHRRRARAGLCLRRTGTRTRAVFAWRCRSAQPGRPRGRRQSMWHALPRRRRARGHGGDVAACCAIPRRALERCLPAHRLAAVVAL